MRKVVALHVGWAELLDQRQCFKKSIWHLFAFGLWEGFEVSAVDKVCLTPGQLSSDIQELHCTGPPMKVSWTDVMWPSWSTWRQHSYCQRGSIPRLDSKWTAENNSSLLHHATALGYTCHIWFQLSITVKVTSYQRESQPPTPIQTERHVTKPLLSLYVTNVMFVVQVTYFTYEYKILYKVTLVSYKTAMKKHKGGSDHICLTEGGWGVWAHITPRPSTLAISSKNIEHLQNWKMSPYIFF